MRSVLWDVLEVFRYSSDDQKELLQGRYVGGIAGYGEHTLLSNCSTEKNGYVLGDEYVAELPEDSAEASQMQFRHQQKAVLL